jgi:hypothetical protein
MEQTRKIDQMGGGGEQQAALFLLPRVYMYIYSWDRILIGHGLAWWMAR